MVARLTLDQFVRVQILAPQPWAALVGGLFIFEIQNRQNKYSFLCIKTREAGLSVFLYFWQDMQENLDQAMSNNDKTGAGKAERTRFLENGQCPTTKTGGEKP